ncbi:polysaccharide pyruvyl transferase family protein [Pseudaquidulcibacter saccharophilus]|uniref:polysaccharide pyruvyl transferase family protein n=1 Tax=Pseudaquidulcibacter saccharophilus TaxID=2831900 RepID=UPI001EFEF30B|nr:polysaccharide pyruvyl transferase family protein [Pseudaquidulcibacter saccharophilus]
MENNIKKESNIECVNRISSELRRTYEYTAGYNENGYYLLDFPDHANVGDSAIWVGEEIVLNEIDDRDAIKTSLVDDKDIPKIKADTIIYLHGGGNFGDIWPAHQNYRNNVLKNFKNNPVVQLPQSIHFENHDNIKETADAIKGHPNFTLLVRDNESFEFANKHFECQTILCPDSAFAIGPLNRTVPIKYDVLLLLRTDKETKFGNSKVSVPNNWHICDWLDDDPNMFKTALWKVRIDAIKSFNISEFSKARREFNYYNTLANMRVKRGLDLLSRGKIIITDRLHVHILSTLLGIPHIVLDNNYQKIKRFSNAFNTSWDGVHWASTIEEAIELAKTIV